MKRLCYAKNMFNTRRFCLINNLLLVGSIATYISGSDLKHVSIETENRIVKLQCKNEALEKFNLFSNILENCGDGEIPIHFSNNEEAITPYMVEKLLLQAEDLTKDILLPTSFHNSIGLIQLAEQLMACDELKDKVAQICYGDDIYDTLRHAAFNTKNTPEPKFEREAARQWLVRCIPNAPDNKKIELRKILYPLQYSSAAFATLKEKVRDILKTKSDTKTEFHELDEFKTWKNSFEHQAYLAARPSNALSCTEFHTAKEKNNLFIRDSHNGPNVVDLSDCYNLDSVSLYFRKNFYGDDIKTSEADKHLEHLPQIHLPLLELLIHYKGINYKKFGESHASNSKLFFGTNTVELHAIDIKALESFSLPKKGSRPDDSITCIFNIKTKKVAAALKAELAKLRLQHTRFFIELRAPDADIEYVKWKHCYDPISRNDEWRIILIPCLVRATIFAIGLIVICELIAKQYKQQWDIYVKQLNAAADRIPYDVKALAGYIGANQEAIFGKDVGAALPQELVVPSFAGNANDIRLPDTNAALTAINQLQAIRSAHQPTDRWHGIKFLGFGCIGIISKMFLNCMCEEFAKPGIVKSTLRLLGFIKPKNHVACFMEIVRPPQANRTISSN